MLQSIKILFQCKLMRAHNWTCAAEQNIPATKEQLDGSIEGFADYAKMYCKDCGYVYKPRGKS